MENKKITPASKVHLRSLNLQELDQFVQMLGLPQYRALQLADWLHKKCVMDFSEMTNFSKPLRMVLAEHADTNRLELVEVPESKNHESLKYLLKTPDGHILESVLIAQQGRQTVCVSTQLGCRIRCSFFASGKGKFGRNLTAGEIVEQVSVIARYQNTSSPLVGEDRGGGASHTPPPNLP